MNGLAAQIAFYSLAALTLIPALCVVRARSVLHAGFWLLPCFVGIAGFFALLEAHFFFVVQLLIYAGAILVLMLFALMLTRDVMNPQVPQSNRLGRWAGLICGALGIAAAAILARQTWPLTDARPADASAQTRALGEALIGLYAVPFEVASLLLLAALIGAVVLAKSERGPVPETPPLADTAPLTREVAEVVGMPD
ncbi:MAG TPA: NADH-quinone oxidoreductase subunit J [Chthonomonadaceae bacterium]|nr:NADH-quinone oxidoreductase subunit J [Chthonomonadaceae bacterium]